MTHSEQTAKSPSKSSAGMLATLSSPLRAGGSGARSSRRLRATLAVLALAIAAFAITAAPALAEPPTVTTPVVSEVSYASAHLETTIATNGGLIVYSFEYSTDNADWKPGPGGFLQSTASGPVPPATLSGLKGGTEYFVRVSAHNISGDPEVHSPEPNPSFTTLVADPPTVEQVDDASEVAYTTATLTGKVNRPEKSNDLDCHFQYLTDDQFNENPPGEEFAGATSVECEPNPVSTQGVSEVKAHLSGLTNKTAYHLRLVVSNASAEDSQEAPSTFTTLTVDPPSVKSIANASEVEYTQAEVEGVVERPANADPAFDVECNFEYITDEQFATNEANSEPGFAGATPVACEPEAEPAENPIRAGGESPVKAKLTGLAASTIYHLRLSATNQGGSDSEVAAATFATEGPVPMPTVLSVADATDVTYKTANVSGAVERPAGGDPALNLNCRFEVVTDSQFNDTGFEGATQAPCEPESNPAENPITAAGPTAVSAQLTTLRSGFTYHLRLVAENAAGTTAKEATDTFTTVSGGDTKTTIDKPIMGYTTAQLSGTITRGALNQTERIDPYFEFTEAGAEQWAGPACGECFLIPTGPGATSVSYEFKDLNPDTEYEFRLSYQAEGVQGPPDEPFAAAKTRHLEAPTATIDPITTFTGTTARLSGVVDTHAPAGPLDALGKGAYETNWHFECTPACDGPGGEPYSGTVEGEEGNKAISVEATHLDANSYYEVKLVAHNSFYNVETPTKTFQTPLVLPDVQSTAGSPDGEGGYTIQGVIDSNNSKLTRCEFEWGPNNTYPNAFKAPCLPFPSGPDEVQLLNVEALQGQYRLSFRGQSTTDLDYNATPAEVQSALEALSSVGSDGVSVADGGVAIPEVFSYSITFAGKLAGANVEPIKASDGTTPLGGGAGASVSTTIEGGTDHPIVVEAHLTGLTVGAGYHFRIFATDAAGDASSVDRTFTPTLNPKELCANESLREENSSLALPECRAYEMVSPPGKEGFTAKFEGYAAGGDRVEYESGAGNIARSGQGVLNNKYVTNRTAAGWETIPDLNGSSGSIFDAPSEVVSFGPLPKTYSKDLLSSVWTISRRGDPGGGQVYLRNPDGTFARVGETLGPEAGEPLGASDDLTHVAFDGISFATLPGGYRFGPGVYEFVGTGNGLPRRVDLDNLDAPATECPFETASLGGVEVVAKGRAVSDDGRVIVFSVAGGCGGANPPADELWARVDGTTSFDLSASQCNRTAAEPGGVCNGPVGSGACTHVLGTGEEQGPDCRGAHFKFATPDGSRVFFTTTQQLVDGDTDQTADLYACDIPSGVPAPVGKGNSCAALMQVSSAVTGAAKVEEVLTTSEDGSTVLFTAKGVLAANEDALKEQAVAGDDNLYVWRQGSADPDGQMTFLGRLESSKDPFGLQTQSTPDGHYVVFATGNQLVPTDTDGTRDVYRYDADNGELIRVSSNVAGVGGNGDLDAGLSEGRSVSDDGEKVVFTTSEALSSADGNGEPDVYLWSAGHVSLMSTGASGGGAAILPGTSFSPAIDGSGQDIYLQTAAALTPADGDDSVDVYDARIGGGFSFAPAVPCSGETCRPSPSNPPTPPAPTTAQPPAEPGNVKACPKGKVKKHGKCVKKPRRKQGAKKSHGKKAGHKQGGGK